MLFANKPVAEDFEVAARELNEVDDDGTGLLAGADGEVSKPRSSKKTQVYRNGGVEKYNPKAINHSIIRCNAR